MQFYLQTTVLYYGFHIWNVGGGFHIFEANIIFLLCNFFPAVVICTWIIFICCLNSLFIFAHNNIVQIHTNVHQHTYIHVYMKMHTYINNCVYKIAYIQTQNLSMCEYLFCKYVACLSVCYYNTAVCNLTCENIYVRLYFLFKSV